MNRGEVWQAQIGRKRRPVLVLTRDEVIDVRTLVTVAEITSSARGIAAEVPIDLDDIDLDQPSAVNCDGVHTVRQTMLTKRIGSVDETTMLSVCSSIAYALGC